jgi:hypothetical protein
MDEECVFLGFNTSFNGYSQLPNEWLDDIVSQIDNVAELKIVLYVYRHTWGYQEKKVNPDDPAKHDEIKHITTDEFMHGRKRKDGSRIDRGTGLSNRSVIDGTRNAVKHGYITEEIDDTDKGRVAKSYALNMMKSIENSCEETSHQVCNSFTSDVQHPHSSSADSSQRTEKDTRGKKQRKESMKESASIHSFTLSSDCLNKVSEFAALYGFEGNDDLYHELARSIYRQYVISDDDFYNYLIEAYAASSKTKRMTVFFEKLQEMLGDNFEKREQQ